MARLPYDSDSRYEDTSFRIREDRVNDNPVVIIREDNSRVDQTTTPQATADQNNYPLPPGDLIRLSTDASRNFTGFAGSRPGVIALVNVGSFDVVIVNDSGSSTAENRVLCHTGGNITLNPGESVFIVYDFESARWRTVGFS